MVVDGSLKGAAIVAALCFFFVIVALLLIKWVYDYAMWKWEDSIQQKVSHGQQQQDYYGGGGRR